MNLSAKDRELLDLLSEDARAPVASLAKKLGLSRTTVQTRLHRLESMGVIAGYNVRLADAYAASMARAYVMITLAPKALTQVCAAIGAINSVKSLHSVSGAFDLIAIVEAPSISGLDQIIDGIGMLDGVERTHTSIILSTRISR